MVLWGISLSFICIYMYACACICLRLHLRLHMYMLGLYMSIYIYLGVVFKNEHVWVFRFWLHCISCTYRKGKKKSQKKISTTLCFFNATDITFENYDNTIPLDERHFKMSFDNIYNVLKWSEIKLTTRIIFVL